MFPCAVARGHLRSVDADLDIRMATTTSVILTLHDHPLEIALRRPAPLRASSESHAQRLRINFLAMHQRGWRLQGPAQLCTLETSVSTRRVRGQTTPLLPDSLRHRLSSHGTGHSLPLPYQQLITLLNTPSTTHSTTILLQCRALGRSRSHRRLHSRSCHPRARWCNS